MESAKNGVRSCCRHGVPALRRGTSLRRRWFQVALVRTDPFREIDRFFQQAFAGGGERSWGMPMDAYRKDDMFLLQLDVPGIPADGIELSVDNNVLTVKATRHAPTMQEGVQPVVSERPWGEFTRQVLL